MLLVVNHFEFIKIVCDYWWKYWAANNVGLLNSISKILIAGTSRLIFLIFKKNPQKPELYYETS